jgi:hypothetical protein
MIAGHCIVALLTAGIFLATLLMNRADRLANNSADKGEHHGL